MFRSLILSTVTLAALAASLLTATTASAGNYWGAYNDPCAEKTVISYNYGHKKHSYQNCYKKAVWGWDDYQGRRVIIRYKTICN